jgi:probable HAF family extracellular repeat protein
VSSTDIPDTIGGSYVIPRALDELGQIVGSAAIAGDASVHAFLWNGTAMVDLGTLGGAESHALAVNGHGEAVGYSALPGGTVSTRATLWRNGEIVDLGELGGGFSIAARINDLGEIVGNSLTTGGQTHAFLWKDGVMQDLGTLGGGFSTALRINERGQIVGRSSVPGEADYHTFLWENGVMTDLGKGEPGDLAASGDVLVNASPTDYLWRDGTRTPIVPFGNTVAYNSRDLNDARQVTGTARRADGHDVAFFWDDGTSSMIGPQELQGYVTPLALNANGQVAGFVGQHDLRAFSWKSGELTPLTAQHQDSIALAINSRGQIMGTRANVAVRWDTYPCATGGDAGAADAGAGDGGGADAGGDDADAGSSSCDDAGDTDAGTGTGTGTGT